MSWWHKKKTFADALEWFVDKEISLELRNGEPWLDVLSWTLILDDNLYKRIGLREAEELMLDYIARNGGWPKDALLGD